MNTITCFAVPMKDPMQPGDVHAISVDEEGKYVSGQVCSSVGWAQSDMMFDRHADKYAERYPDGHETQWSDHPPENWDGVGAD